MSYLTEIMREQANVNDDKLSFILELDRATARETLKELKAAFPTVVIKESSPEADDEDWRPMTKKESEESFRRSTVELVAILKGEKQGRPIEELLDEL